MEGGVLGDAWRDEGFFLTVRLGRDGLKRYKEAAPFISSSPHVGQNDIRFIRLIVESTDPSWKKEMQIEFTDYITALDNECVMTHGARESANVQVHLKPHAERSDATVKKNSNHSSPRF